ncbi:hypothetical protein E2562_033231 [Oryza meyeriana var. granulata]|uniref:Delta(14)-sterol reductase n=1 Tax=Oryza meyeriana var. granulata TaxID=110450 RepID=A0A6G1BPZ8_9ORYZ|nr:hypothetical protein E2562_033231 [Oryza meyeriana var. granulata]
MEVAAALAAALVPSWSAMVVLFSYLGYLAVAGAILPGKLVPGAVLPDSSRLHYRCNGLLSLLLLLGLCARCLHGMDVPYGELAYSLCLKYRALSCSLEVLNPHFMGVDLKWDIIAERLGFMLVFGDLVFIPFTFTIQGWWLLRNKVELSLLAAMVNCFIFVIGYLVFRGANKQKHVFKKNPKALIWGKPPKLVGGKLLASGYWGIARHCNYLGDILLALSFSLPCGTSSVIPYFYPTYLFILLIWRERRDEARCSEKYKEIWVEYCKLVPWRIFPYVY